MRRLATALVSAAAGVGVVLGLHGSRSPVDHSNANRAVGHHSSRGAGSHRNSAQQLRDGAVVGATEQYGYGVLSVQVTASGGRITNVSTVDLRIAEPFSQQIAARAIPILRSEVLDAQSANVSTVSGATYTSEAYLTSIQSALDRLR